MLKLLPNAANALNFSRRKFLGDDGSPVFTRGYDSATVSYCLRAGITDPSTMDIVEDFVTGSKADGTWTLLFAVYPFIGGSAAAHSENLVSAAYPITWVNVPTHDFNGVTFSGTNYGRCTGLTGGSVLPINMGMTCYNRTQTSSVGGTAKRYMGFVDAGGLRYYVLDISDFAGFEGLRGCLGATARYIAESPANPVERVGTLAVNRTSGTSCNIYNNGIDLGSNTGAESNTPDSLDVWLGCMNQNNVPASGIIDNLALAAVHQGMTAAQALTFHTRIQDLQTALGRNV